MLCTTARIDGKLHGFTFSTLERIGGTPCVLLGLMSVKRTSKRDQVLKGLMGEAYHRALMAFPDEDVVIGSRFVNADGLEAFKQLDEVTPSPGHRAVGEERAWGRRLAKRFGVEATYDEQSFVVDQRRAVRLSRPRVVEAREDQPGDRRACSRRCPSPRVASLVVHGWTMAEDLVKLGAAEPHRHGRVRRGRSPSADDAGVRRHDRSTPPCSTTGRPRVAGPECRQDAGLAPRRARGRRDRGRSGTSRCPPCGATRSAGKQLLERAGDRPAVRRLQGLHRPLRASPTRCRPGSARAPTPGRCRTGRSTRRCR